MLTSSNSLIKNPVAREIKPFADNGSSARSLARNARGYCPFCSRLKAIKKAAEDGGDVSNPLISICQAP